MTLQRTDRALRCPDCDAMVTGKEEECPQCSKRFEKGTKFKCPSCGAPVTKRMQRCPSCKETLSVTSEKFEPQPEQPAASPTTPSAPPVGDVLARKDAPIKGPSCPSCGAKLKGDESICHNCGRLLKSKMILRCPLCDRPVEVTEGRCPTCGTSLHLAGSSVGAGAVSNPVSKPAASKTAVPSTHPCPLCGAIVPKGLNKCPLCGTSLLEPQVDLPTPASRETEVRIPETPVEETGKVASQTAKVMKQRRLKVAPKMTAQAEPLAGTRSHVNGLGHINGLRQSEASMQGARGAINGTGLVNGTGMTNGSRSSPSSGKAVRRTAAARWKLVAVLLAAVILIPTFIFISYANKSDEFSVDGVFDEWEGAQTYGVVARSSSATDNITEWAVGINPTSLFLYFRTQTPMMSTADAESYYLFVDSDGSNGTGYAVGSIGADYLLQLTGWDSEVKSTALCEYTSASDHYNWSAWVSVSTLSCAMDLGQLEAGATMPVQIGHSARFLLVSKDASDRGAVSCVAPLKGGVLVVRQRPSDAVAASGIVPKESAAAILILSFSCQGAGGKVSKVDISLSGALSASQIPGFSLEKGETKEVTVTMDSSSLTIEQLVSAQVLASGIDSDFAAVQIVGAGARAYVGAAPATVSIDGAFADWTGRLSMDSDPSKVANPNVDISAIGNVSDSSRSCFYVSVQGSICSGTFIPASISKPSGSGGAAVVSPRRTAEDALSIYVDSDKSTSTGLPLALNSKLIGADQKIELKGIFGRISSAKEFDYSPSTGGWVQNPGSVTAAKDDRRIELSVSSASLGGSSDIDFIVETTSWKGREDMAVFDPISLDASAMTWVVDSTTSSPYSTSMSYQRKMFYDGVNTWSFYFDGATTVHKYSTDDGQTWTASGSVFRTPKVNETSIWYDQPTKTVYAVGDTSAATTAVFVQRGSIDAVGHKIAWAASDSIVNTSLLALSGKNTFISKSRDGFLWIISSNMTQSAPASYQLSVFRSTVANSTTSWALSGQMLGAVARADNIKGSVVPDMTLGNVWAVYAYGGNVAARMFAGTWQAQQIIYTQVGSKANTDNAPPSVVVDGKGVVHVVYGTGRNSGSVSVPMVQYSHNLTGSTTFTPGQDLDAGLAAGVGDYYPTITFDSSTGNLFAMWVQGSSSVTSQTVVCKKCVAGAWTFVTVEPQTAFTKLFLTSPYSIPNEQRICWQWTQNVTAPIEVVYDGNAIPEFGDLVLPMMVVIIAFVLCRRRQKGDEDAWT